MIKFRKLGFIDYDGGLSVHSSLLNVIPHDGLSPSPGFQKTPRRRDKPGRHPRRAARVTARPGLAGQIPPVKPTIPRCGAVTYIGWVSPFRQSIQISPENGLSPHEGRAVSYSLSETPGRRRTVWVHHTEMVSGLSGRLAAFMLRARQRAVLQRCHAEPKTRRIATFIPSCPSEITSFTPRGPRWVRGTLD
jgi:hypothetical protein